MNKERRRSRIPNVFNQTATAHTSSLNEFPSTINSQRVDLEPYQDHNSISRNNNFNNGPFSGSMRTSSFHRNEQSIVSQGVTAPATEMTTTAAVTGVSIKQSSSEQKRTWSRYLWEICGFHQLTWQQRVTVMAMIALSPIVLYLYDLCKGIFFDILHVMFTFIKQFIPHQIIQIIILMKQMSFLYYEMMIKILHEVIDTIRILHKNSLHHFQYIQQQQQWLYHLLQQQESFLIIIWNHQLIIPMSLIKFMISGCFAMILCFYYDADINQTNEIIYQLIVLGNWDLLVIGIMGSREDHDENESIMYRDEYQYHSINEQSRSSSSSPPPPYIIKKTKIFVEKLSIKMKAMKYRTFRFGQNAIEKLPKKLTGVITGGYKKSVNKISMMPLMMKYFFSITILSIWIRWLIYHCTLQIIFIIKFFLQIIIQSILPFFTTIIFILMSLYFIIKCIQWFIQRRIIYQNMISSLVRLTREVFKQHESVYPIDYLFEEVKDSLENVIYYKQQQLQHQLQDESKENETNKAIATPIGTINFLSSSISSQSSHITATTNEESKSSLSKRLFNFILSFVPFLGNMKQLHRHNDRSNNEVPNSIALAAIAAADAMKAGGYSFNKKTNHLWITVQQEIQRDVRIQCLELIVDGRRQKCWRLLQANTAARF